MKALESLALFAIYSFFVPFFQLAVGLELVLVFLILGKQNLKLISNRIRCFAKSQNLFLYDYYFFACVS